MCSETESPTPTLPTEPSTAVDTNEIAVRKFQSLIVFGDGTKNQKA